MHLTPLPSKEISAPGIAESPVNIECKVREIKPLGSHTMFLADVVNVTVDDAFFDEKNTFHLNNTGLVTYSHGAYFLLGKKLGTFGYSVARNGNNLRFLAFLFCKDTDASITAYFLLHISAV